MIAIVIQAASSATSAVNLIKLGATIAVALAAVTTTFIAVRARKTVQEIHVLVDGKLTAALSEITRLGKALEIQKHLPAVAPEQIVVDTDEEIHESGTT